MACEFRSQLIYFKCVGCFRMVLHWFARGHRLAIFPGKLEGEAPASRNWSLETSDEFQLLYPSQAIYRLCQLYRESAWRPTKFLKPRPFALSFAGVTVNIYMIVGMVYW